MIRLACIDDLNEIWKLRCETKELLNMRHIDQWQFENPSIETFRNDIFSQEFYVFVDGNDLKGMMAVRSGIEETYNMIYDGAWRLDVPYLTIHRLAVKRDLLGQDIAHQLMKYSDEIAKQKNIHYMRIDTHQDNRYAIKLFQNHGYVLCGWIKLNQNKGDINRLAFDKIL